MRHPDPSDLLDHRKGELPEEHAREIELHLELCDECRAEWETYGSLEQRLGAWQPEETRGALANKTLQRLDREEMLPSGRAEPVTRSRRLPRWARRATLATVAVAASLLFQAMVWNPFGELAPFRAIISLTSPAYAMSAGQAAPDTILVLTVHQDKTMSTRVIPGSHEIDELIDELIALLQPGQYTEILVVGDDPENQVTISTSDLDPLTEALEISSVRFGEGIVAFERIRNEILAYVQVPVHTIRTDYVIRHALIDSVRAAVDLDMDRAGTLHLVADSLRVIIARSALVVDSLLTGTVEIRMTPQRLRIQPQIRVNVIPHIEIAQSIIGQQIIERIIEARIDSLSVPIRAVLTVNKDGLVLLDRSAVPVDEVEGALRRLKDRNPGIALLILIPEGSGEDNPGYLLVKIARDLGIEKVTVKKVKK